jgi:hypothetical protein
MKDIFDDIPDEYEESEKAIAKVDDNTRLTKKQRREQALQSNTVVRCDWIDEYSFTCKDIKTARQLLITNKLEFLKWALKKATTESYTPLGEKLAVILAKEFVSDANSIDRLKEEEQVDPYEGLKTSVLKKILDGEMVIEDVQACDYQGCEVVEGEIVEGDSNE